jgi:hypothetical protein
MKIALCDLVGILVMAVVVPVTVAEAGQLWTPADTTTYAWYDASDASTIHTNNANGRVSQLDDKSGSGQHMGQTVTSRQPVTGVRTVNGLNVLDCDATVYQSLERGDWSGLPSNLTAVVVSAVDNLTNYSLVNFQDAFGVGANGIYAGKPTANNIGSSLTYTSYKNSTNIFCASLTWDDSATLPLSFFNSFVDGSQKPDTNAYTRKVLASGNRFGLMQSNNNLNTADGAIMEVIITKDDSSDDTRQKIEGYLAWKWGLQANLPVAHPYRNRAPANYAMGTVITIR